MSDGSGKDTIYIDIDDEITSIIDKVRGSKERILALVLPKRAAVLQSIVNMKLLKRAADVDKKRLVLITSEAGLLPLAAAAGIHVARTLQSKPMIPLANINDDAAAEAIGPMDLTDLDDETPEVFDTDAAGNQPIGELAGAGGAAALADDTETIELDNDPTIAPTAAAAAAAAVKNPKVKKDKKLAIPDFDRFRLVLILGIIALIILGILIYLAFFVLPKAKLTVFTDSSDITTNQAVTLDPDADELNADDATVPAKSEQKQQTSTQQVAATGSKNLGNKASGDITVTAGSCSADVPNDIPAGTGVSANGLTFITQDDTQFVPAISKGKCSFQSSNPTSIVAERPGANYNIGGTSFSVAGRSDVSARSSNGTNGGSDNIVKVVQQSDIDAAKQKIATSDADTVKGDLKQSLQSEGYYAIDVTFIGSTPSITSSNSVGDQANNVSVTQTVTYTIFGAKKDDLRKIVTANVKKQIDASKQVILNDGLDGATYKVVDTSPEKVQMQVVSTAGPDLNQSDIKKRIAGKKSGDIQSLLKQYPGVTDSQVKFSPFWVTKAPKNPSKVTITLEKASTSNGQ